MTYTEHLIEELYKILGKIDQLCDQAGVYNKHEKELVALYATLDVIIGKIENSK